MFPPTNLHFCVGVSQLIRIPTFTLKIKNIIMERVPVIKEAVTTEEIIFKYLKSLCPIQVNIEFCSQVTVWRLDPASIFIY